MKFATKPLWQYPTHLGACCYTTLEIKNSNFMQIFCRNANTLHFNRL